MVQRNALQIAAHLIKLGLAPVALMAPDDPRELLKPAAQRGKQPILARWNEGPAPKSVKDMPELRPEHNVGIRTGFVAGARHCVVALDEDSEGAHYFCEDTQPSTTMETLTGRMTAGWRGRHRFYRRPEGGRFPNRALKVKWQNPFNDDRVEVLALDVRGDGGQVVAPGSLHGTGGLYEEAATWTEAMLQSLPVLDLAALEKCLADTKADSKAIDDKFPRAQRVRRFRAYLEKCEPSYPQMPPYGAGAHALIIARAGVWGLDLPVEVVAEEMQRSGWNKKCKFDDGSPYPWSLEELRHKCKDADRMATSDGDMQKRRGWMLEEPEKKSERAVIEITPNVSKVASEVLVALADARDSLGSPLVYASSGHLSVVQPPGIHWLDRHALSLAMDKAAMFQVHVERGRGDEKEIVAEQKQPPMHIADKILSAGHWPELPALKRISRLPPVTLSGCIGLKPGYDMQSQIYYLGQPVHIPDAPTKSDAQAALQRILRYVRSVKFATDTDKAKWVAYLLTFATRTAYDKAPVFLISAAFQGCLTGDTLIHTNRGKIGRKHRLDYLVNMSNGGTSTNYRKWGNNKTKLRSLYPNGHILLNSMVRAFATGVKPVYELKTKSGKSIKATADHRFLTDTQEWKRLHELKINDCIMVEPSCKPQIKGRQPKHRYLYTSGLTYHPYAGGGLRCNNKPRHQVLTHRLIAEAALNRMEYSAFIAMVRAGRTEGLVFLDPKEFHVHHRDNNWRNNVLENLEVLSPKAHADEHRDLNYANLAITPVADRIISIKYVGREPTYDITMEAPHHNYIANGFVVHNSGKSCIAYMPFKMLYSERLKPADYKESDDPDFGKSLYGWSQMPLVLWDNMPDGKCLRHAALAAILTNGVATARELSKHSFLDSDFGATIFCYTGNKVTLDADLACRAVVINLLGKPDKDPNFSPEQDRAFDAIRPGVLRDVYTIIRAWALAGCPPQPAQPHDRFGEWSQVVQQIVLWLGLENPVTSNDDMNADKDHLMVFLHEAERLFKDKPFRAQDLIEMATNGGRSAVEAVAAVAELCRQRRAESAIRLGQQLKAICQRDAEGLVLLHCGATNGYHRYRIARSAISRASGDTQAPQSVPQAQLLLGSATEKKGNANG